MMTFVMVALGVFVGSLMAGVAGVMLVFNKRFMKWYTKKTMKLMEGIGEDLCEMYEHADED